MKRSLALALIAALLFTACGERLSGRYEMVAEIPHMEMPKGTDPKIQRQMDDVWRRTQDMSRMSLEFEGSTIKMGTPYAISEYKYRIDGSRLEILSEAMGQKTVLPMTIEADGSITYMGMKFSKVR